MKYPTYWNVKTADGAHAAFTVDAPSAQAAIERTGRTYSPWQHQPQPVDTSGWTAVRSYECSGLAGDPNHQGAHCACRY